MLVQTCKEWPARGLNSTFDKKDERMMSCLKSVGSSELWFYMLYDDHRPPHFHAEYGEYKVTVDINTGVVEGRFPRRALKALLEWYELYREQLLEDWTLAEQHQPLNRIPPLE